MTWLIDIGVTQNSNEIDKKVTWLINIGVTQNSNETDNKRTWLINISVVQNSNSIDSKMIDQYRCCPKLKLNKQENDQSI